MRAHLKAAAITALALGAACSTGSTGASDKTAPATPPPSPTPTVACVPFPSERIADGWFDFPVNIERTAAVRSENFEAVWYVAARAKDAKGQEVTGIWAILGEDMDGLTMAVGTGELFSSMGKAISPDSPVGGPKKVEKVLGLPIYPHGYSEAKRCVR